jgi:hypothetical protein
LLLQFCTTHFFEELSGLFSLIESGHYSIAGFFFQLLASANDALKLFLMEDDQKNPTAVFEIERLGQDAVAYPDNGRPRLIQYKYSSVDAELGPTELRDVLIAFKKSLDDGNLKAIDVDLFLTTNRKLNSVSEDWKKATNATEFKSLLHDGVSEEGLTKLPYTLLWPIFQRLVFTQIGPNDASRGMASLGRQYGMRVHEIEPGIQKVIGLLLQTASLPGSRSLSRAKLVEALVQHPSPYRLNGEESVDLQRREVLSFRNAETQFTKTISRSISSQIALMTTSHPVVIVKGDGGVGKSVTMSDAALINLESPAQPPAFALILKAADLERSSVQSAVARWRNQSNNPDGNDLRQCLERLLGVSPSIPTIAIYVDGIDERGGLLSLSFDARQSLMGLIQAAIEPTIAEGTHSLSIVISCRTEAELQGLGGGGFSPSGSLMRISVGDFDRGDLEALATSLQGDPDLTNRIKAHFGERRVRSSTHRQTNPTAVNSDRAKLLSRPIIWRFFAQLSDAQKHAFLDGSQDALEALATEYKKWFFNKVAQRIGQLQRDLSEVAYASVAKKSIDGKNLIPKTYSDDWIEPLRSIGCPEIHHRQLFDEGLSAGIFEMIDTGNQIWQWKYDWLRDSFAKGDNWNDR